MRRRESAAGLKKEKGCRNFLEVICNYNLLNIVNTHDVQRNDARFSLAPRILWDGKGFAFLILAGSRASFKHGELK